MEDATVQPAHGSRNARGLATARRIEAAAVRLATEHGVDGLTVDAVCAEAGVSQRTFFHHFPTKEDALLGLDLPVLDEERVRAYLSDPSVGVLAGALTLVRLPGGMAEDPAGTAAQLRLVADSPALYRRQAERLAPLMGEVRRVVLQRLRSMAEAEGGPVDEALLGRQADLVTALGAGIMQSVATTVLDDLRPPPPPDEALAPLRGIWSRLL